MRCCRFLSTARKPLLVLDIDMKSPLQLAGLFLGMMAWTVIVAAERPSVLVILTDDQCWGDLSVHRNNNLSTPNIDQLARDGASFD